MNRKDKASFFVKSSPSIIDPRLTSKTSMWNKFAGRAEDARPWKKNARNYQENRRADEIRNGRGSNYRLEVDP
jgi:hypothetical protein